MPTGPNAGLNSKLPTGFEKAHAAIDGLLDIIEGTRKEALLFKDEFSTQLQNKEIFYNNLGKGDMENSDVTDQPGFKPETFKLNSNDLAEIKKSAEEVRLALKEKYLGRLPGQKRGEATVAYAGSISALSGLLGLVMLGFLGYVHY